MGNHPQMKRPKAHKDKGKEMGKKNKKNNGNTATIDPTADMFAGVEKAPMPGSGRWFTDGVYLVRVEAFKRGISRKGDGAFSVVEATILEVLVPYDASNREGERVSWIVMMKHGETSLSNLKGFAAAALDCDESDVTAGALLKASDGDGTALKGLELIATAVTQPTRTGGKYTKVTWSSEDEDDE